MGHDELKTDKRLVLRLIDANCNRMREGLRVVEELFRMIYEDEELTLLLKKLRHEGTCLVNELVGSPQGLLEARQVETDAGKTSKAKLDTERESLCLLMMANFRRAEEALRVLEEYSKLVNPSLSDGFRRLRFETYQLEQKAVLRYGKEK